MENNVCILHNIILKSSGLHSSYHRDGTVLPTIAHWLFLYSKSDVRNIISNTRECNGPNARNNCAINTAKSRKTRMFSSMIRVRNYSIMINNMICIKQTELGKS